MQTNTLITITRFQIDNGANWNLTGVGVDGNSFAVSDNNIYTGDWYFYHSSDYGLSWSQINNPFLTRRILSVALSGSNLFSGIEDSSVFLSTDNGISWTAVNEGLPDTLGIFWSSASPLVTNNSYIFTGILESGDWSETNNISYNGGEGVWRRPLSEMITSVSDQKSTLPQNFSLQQNYPNPFNPSTTIRYEIPERSFVTIKVYDILGKEIDTFVNEEKPSGTYEVEFDARNLPSGIYFYQLKAGSFVETKKMILLK